MTVAPSTVIVDMDGVLYRGTEAIPGADEALHRLEHAGHQVVFVTNNSTRTTKQVAAKLKEVLGYEADPEQIVTSAMAAVALLPENASRCMVVGGDGIREAVLGAGTQMTDDPTEASCVVVGLDPEFDYNTLDRAASAVRRGATFIATNRDPTFPTSDGLKPGAGSIVAAIEVASGVAPLVAGKPEKPTRDLIHALGVSTAWVIGDRVDTDIALAAHDREWTSILVMTGVTAEDDDTDGADHVVPDISAAVDLVLAQEDER